MFIKHKIIKFNNHLYILSDDKIEEDDYFLHWNGVYKKTKNSIQPNTNSKKIIATTNSELNLPLIPTKFLTEIKDSDEVSVKFNEFKSITVLPEYSEISEYILETDDNNQITIKT